MRSVDVRAGHLSRRTGDFGVGSSDFHDWRSGNYAIMGSMVTPCEAIACCWRLEYRPAAIASEKEVVPYALKASIFVDFNIPVCLVKVFA